MIDMLPIIVKISEEQLLPNCKSYRDQANNIHNYLDYCGSTACKTCLTDQERENSLLLERINDALARINSRDDSLVTEKESSMYPQTY